MKRAMLPSLALCVSILADGLGPQDAQAQQLEPEEIVVTARRTEENLQDVPVSVVALSGEELEAAGLERGEDMMVAVPNVVIAGSVSHASSSDITIRGMPNVGIYLDGVAQSSIGLLQTRLVELERLEVLRGPQGTLFGRNANGGAVQMVTKLPAREFGVRAKAEFGEYDRRDVSVAVDVPLGDALFSKFQAGLFNQDGQLCSLTADACYGGSDDEALRAELLWDNGGRIDMRIAYDRQRIEGSDRRGIIFVDPFYVNVAAINVAASNPAFRSEHLPITEYTPRTHQAGYPGGEVGRWETKDNSPEHGISMDYDAVTLFVNWDVTDSMALESTTAYWDKETFSWRNFRAAEFVTNLTTQYVSWDRVWSQQLMLRGSFFNERVSYLAGVWYEDYDERDVVYRWPAPWSRSLEQATAPPPLPGCRPEPIPEVVDWVQNPDNWDVGFIDYSTVDSLANPESPNHLGSWRPNAPWRGTGGVACDADPLGEDNQDYALFGEVGLAITDRLNLVFGFRWSDRQATDHVYSRAGVPGTAHRSATPTDPQGDVWAANRVRSTDEPGTSVWFTPKVSIDYRWTDDVMLYASYAEGFTAAQVRVTGAVGRTEIDPETVATVELGIHSHWLDRRLRFNGSVFFTDWENIRTSVNPIDPVTGRVISATVNITGGNAEASGAEAELVWQATDSWDISAGVGYLDTKYKELIPGVPVAEGQRFPFAPEFSFTLSSEYRWSLPNGGLLTLRGDYRYMDEYMMHARQSAQLLQDGFGLANARITYGFPNRRWQVYAYGSNLGDEHYWNSGLLGSGGGIFLGQIGPRREIGAGLQLNLD